METPAPRKHDRVDGSPQKPPKPPVSVYNLHLPTSDYRALSAAADAEERPISIVLRRLIRRYLAECKAEQAALENAAPQPVAVHPARLDAAHAA